MTSCAASLLSPHKKLLAPCSTALFNDSLPQNIFGNVLMMRFLITLLTPFVWWFCRLAFKIEFRGVENIPREGACIITPNHVTYADPIWITIPMPRRIYYMAWHKPFRIPVLGLLMKMFGAFPVNLDVAADASAQREAIELLLKGRALVIFPEGGRTRTGKLMPFKMGAFRFALAHGVPIVPVSIKGAETIWPVGKMLPRPGKLVITYHRVIAVDQLSGEATRLELKDHARKLARQTHDVVASELDPASVPQSDDAGFSVEKQCGVRRPH
jgi:1-acyl-sn-glycerol-3-phosphate acyltransferase